MKYLKTTACAAAFALLSACATTPMQGADPRYLAQPLTDQIYTADPSARVWDDGRIYIYASHDEEVPEALYNSADAFDMRDYQVLSMDRPGGPVTVHPPALDVDQVPWAKRQMWAPDASFRDGTYYLYFPAKDADGIFRIGVATSQSPTGPFTPQAEPIEGSYSIDPGLLHDNDGEYYMYLGGIWGGQLQRWKNGTYDASVTEDDPTPAGDPALTPVVARMAPDMLQYAEPLRPVQILDENGDPLLAGDHDRRFFEGAWVFRRGDTYYLTYSTGETHYLVYATGTSPYGPFTYRGRILEPVEGWTTHHSITEIDGKWWLFYHDTQLSGLTHLRNVKMTPLTFRADGSIETIHPMTGAE